MNITQVPRSLVNITVLRSPPLVRRRSTINRRVRRHRVINSRRTNRTSLHLRPLRRLRRLNLGQRIRDQYQLIHSRRKKLRNRTPHRQNTLALPTKGLIKRAIRMNTQRLRRLRRVSRVIPDLNRQAVLPIRSRQFNRIFHGNRRQIRQKTKVLRRRTSINTLKFRIPLPSAIRLRTGRIR